MGYKEDDIWTENRRLDDETEGTMGNQADVRIRTATKGDLPQIFDLYRELNPDDPPINEKDAIEVWDQAVNSGVTYFVADDNGRVTASCYIAIIPNITRQCSSIGFIENVITAAEYRRLGIGRRLLEAAIEYAKTCGCYKVALQSGYKRIDAHQFYESLGFDGSSKRAFEIRLKQ